MHGCQRLRAPRQNGPHEKQNKKPVQEEIHRTRHKLWLT